MAVNEAFLEVAPAGSSFGLCGPRCISGRSATVGTVGRGPKAWARVFPWLRPRVSLSRCPGSLARQAWGELVQRAVTVCCGSPFVYRVGWWKLRPVLKHGPRSLTCVRVSGLAKPTGAVKANGCLLSRRGEAVSGQPAGCIPAVSNRPRSLGTGGV